MHRASSFFSTLLAVAALSGCAIMPDDDDAKSESEVTGSCGSALGEAVAKAADEGDKPMDAALTSKRNRVIGGPAIGGEAIMKEISTLIRSAKREVMLEFFDIEEGSWMAQQLRDALRALPKEVKVYVLLNPDQGQRFFGFLAEKPKSRVENMTEFFGDSRVKVASWNDARWLKQLHVLHTKQVIVDGQRAFMTDTNLQANSDPVSKKGKGWYQLGVTVEGEVAQTLRAEMLEAFGHSTPRFDDFDDLPAAKPASCMPVTVLARGAGEGEGASANLGYAALFRAAKENVNVVTPNMNDDKALDALAAATANAQVNIILSKGFNDKTENYPGQGGTNVENVSRLAKMSKNACNLHIRWFSQQQGKAVDGNVAYANHAKWASADALGMIAGSQNLDTQSWKKSRELGIFIDDRAITAKFDQEFMVQWKKAEVAYEKTGCAAAPSAR